MKQFFRLAAFLLVAGLCIAQTTTTTHKKKSTKATTPTTTEQIESMHKQMVEQQAELDALKTQLADRDQQVSAAQQTTTSAQQQAAAAQTKADAAAASSSATADQVTALQTKVADIQTTSTGLTETVIANQAAMHDAIDNPTAFHYKGITVTPVAFFAFEGVYRQHSTNSGLATPFNSIPFPSANEGHVSELNFSGRQSRLGALFQGDAGNFKLSGYFEADFLSAGATSNNNQSNSYTLRQRVIWGQAATTSGFAVTGGQMWSLLTETGHSTDARTEKLPANIDPNYNIGWTWMRQPGIRVQQTFGTPKSLFTLAMSLEQAQIQSFTAAGSTPSNYFYGGAGSGGGLYNSGNAYANNVAPDVILKSTYDLPHAHFELGGLVRFMRDYYYPITSAPGSAYTYAANSISNTKVAGGVYGSVRVTPSPMFTVALQGMAGDGIGRYGAAQLADATVRPDGTLEPIRNFHGLLTIETHPTKKLDIYAYYGGEYDQRTVYAAISNGTPIGYGVRNANDAGCYGSSTNPGSSSGGSDTPANCASPTRYIQEPMIGFTYRVVNSPKYGKLQYAATYQFVQRNLWSGVGSTTTPSGPRAEDPMVHVQMRYYIP